jgi:hypothetical protein
MLSHTVAFLLLGSVAFAQEDNSSTTITQGTQPIPLQVQSGSRPVPDPTALTAEAIRELRTEMTKWIELRFDDLQNQTDRNQLRLDQVQAIVTEALATSEKLTTEKFKGLADQQVQRDNNLALALTAAQKSVSDTNLSTAEAARKAETTFANQISATQKIIDELSQRVTRIESGSAGSGSAIVWVIAAIAAAGSILSIFAFFRQPPVPVPLPVVQYDEPTRPRRSSR